MTRPSLFVRAEEIPGLRSLADGWTIKTPEGEVQVRVTSESLTCESPVDGCAWRVQLGTR